MINTLKVWLSSLGHKNDESQILAELEAKNIALQKEISAHEQTEVALRQSEEASRQIQKQFIALQEVSLELAQAESFDDLYRSAVEKGLSQLGIDRMSIWILDPVDPNFMHGTFGTDEHGNIRDERHIYQPAGPAELFDNGRLLDVNIKSWRRNVLYDAEHNVVGEGWNAIAPLWRRDDVIGFISADNLIEKRPFSNEILELLGLYATSLSHLIFRKQEEEKAKRRRDMLEKVMTLGKEVTQVVDLRECLFRIYKSIKGGLGFDRVGLFLYDEQTRLVSGTFGTDREGNMQEEWDMILSADILSPSGKPLYMAERLIFVSEYKDAYGLHADDIVDNMVGVKEHVRLVSWTGEHPVAVINVDNLVTQRRITEEQVEALQIFAGYAGLAIENARLLAKVREAEQQYRSIVENAIEGIFQVAPEGYFLSANPAMAHMLGFELPQELIDGITDIGSEIYTIPERRLLLRQQLEEKTQVHNFEFEVKRRDGGQAWLSQNVQLVHDDEGNLLYFEGTAQDVTARRKAEEEREALIVELERRNAELERFTYTVSHDLKSPLITIQGFLGFVKQDAIAGNVERLEADIIRISEATGRMQQLLDELLDLSRIGRLINPSEEVAFAVLVEEAVGLVSGRLMQGNVQVMVVPNLPVVYVDHRRIVEVVQNLVDNAAKFMGNQPEPRIDIGVKYIDGETLFFVRDNGIGISPKYQDKVFGLFERLDQSVDGTGIGLALVRRIIEVHNGRLWVESEGEGHGTTFYFTLPLANGEPFS